MCIAVLKPPKIEIDEKTLNLCWIHNSDGAGFAYVRNKRVEISKGHMTLQAFKEAYLATFARNKNSPFLIHFRIRTDGARNEENTHPFELACGGALIHNGVISGTGAKDQGASDTALFVQKYGKVLTFDNISAHKKAIESAVGWNKLVTLYPDKSYQIINEVAGYWHDGAWYSNKTFEPKPSAVYNSGDVNDLWDNWGYD